MTILFQYHLQICVCIQYADSNYKKSLISIVSNFGSCLSLPFAIKHWQKYDYLVVSMNFRFCENGFRQKSHIGNLMRGKFTYSIFYFLVITIHTDSVSCVIQKF